MRKILLILLVSVPVYATSLQPKRVYSVPTKQAGEELQDQRGFGEKESEVRMMNLMMVEGSGYEGMDMAQAKVAPAPAESMHDHGAVVVNKVEIELSKTPKVAKTGNNIYEFTVKDSKQLPKVEVYMTSMDMGTESPKVKQLKPGLYQVKVNFSMEGPWAIKVISEKNEKVFDVIVSR